MSDSDAKTDYRFFRLNKTGVYFLVVYKNKTVRLFAGPHSNLDELIVTDHLLAAMNGEGAIVSPDGELRLSPGLLFNRDNQISIWQKDKPLTELDPDHYVITLIGKKYTAISK